MREAPVGLVPESAIDAVAKTLHAEDANYGNSAAEFSYTDEDWAAQDEGDREAYREWARRAVAAAVPHIERAIRDKVYGEINLAADKQPRNLALGMYAGARVARGGEATE
jgi:hypothetical protein